MMKFNFYAGGIGASWILTLSVILAELVEPFKDFLTSTFTHHWIGKIVLVAIMFLIFGFIYKEKKMFGKNIGYVAWKSITWSLNLIFLFYLVYYFL